MRGFHSNCNCKVQSNVILALQNSGASICEADHTVVFTILISIRSDKCLQITHVSATIILFHSFVSRESATWQQRPSLVWFWIQEYQTLATRYVSQRFTVKETIITNHSNTNFWQHLQLIWPQVNEVLNVGTLSLTTSTISDSVAKTAIQSLETKVNEILNKNTLVGC